MGVRFKHYRIHFPNQATQQYFDYTAPDTARAKLYYNIVYLNNTVLRIIYIPKGVNKESVPNINTYNYYNDQKDSSSNAAFIIREYPPSDGYTIDRIHMNNIIYNDTDNRTYIYIPIPTEISTIYINPGETIRFYVTNYSKISVEIILSVIEEDI